MRRDRSPRQIAGIIAGIYALAVVGALIVTLESLSTGSFHGLDNLPQIPLALPWFIIVPSTRNYVLDAYISALLGFVNAGIIFWIVNRYIKKRRALQ